MKYLAPFLSFAAAVSPAIACEGPCIVGVTQVWVSNYTARVEAVFNNVAQEIAQRFVPSHTGDVPSYLRPMFTAYDNNSYDGMEHAIFPSFFHGKCQRNGVDPPGCPNPDCPVVCGTPGSLVHFFPTLRYIAFNQTRSLLEKITKPGFGPYDEAENAIERAAAGSGARRTMHARAKAEQVRQGLRDIMKGVPGKLEQACGGDAADTPEGLPGCSWEREMKEYILTWP
ncbi:hypothetical protein K488DRAFT_76384 [Vararia minispora EC-137]|uniref:Uncharacterized protein n=1 Tax=Vararia minispora EC-137 TaxID=1314806 RepID=A0ACB8QVC8_9AGAM|nr:hypothetical protein K488DRAFT_76384 [Vararia minispora EC-137]